MVRASRRGESRNDWRVSRTPRLEHFDAILRAAEITGFGVKSRTFLSLAPSSNVLRRLELRFLQAQAVD